METPDKKELIEGISALLTAYEEPYKPGAWEEFSRQRKNKRNKQYAWIATAAALVLLFSAIPYFFNSQPPLQYTAAPKLQQLPKLKQRDEAIKIVEPEEIVSLVPVKKMVKQAKSKISKLNLVNDSLSAVEQDIQATVKYKVEEKNTTVPKNKTVPAEQSFMDYLNKETARQAKVEKKNTVSKWNFGVELMPTVLQRKVNVGAGLTTEFKLSKQFSISSGIAYVALDVSKNMESQSVSLMSSKSLIGVEAAISGIDIPVSLTYNLNKKLYTSMGVSYFNIINEQRSNKYQTELQVTSSSRNVETGITETVQTILSEQSAEVSTETPLEGNSYLGFFNFSVGHKQEIFKNYHIVIEPFMKVPIGKLSNEDLKLGNGGVKLRFTF
ncbi:hypothetical protein [Pedobacter sp.]|uniref:hypothetical protein n=1 Tax=Pedobacter sp. TaxID=1411316 RepID=UPI003D7FDB42